MSVLGSPILPQYSSFTPPFPKALNKLRVSTLSSYSAVSQAHIKQLQPIQILAPLQSEPNKKEPETEQQ